MFEQFRGEIGEYHSDTGTLTSVRMRCDYVRLSEIQTEKEEVLHMNDL